MRKPFLAAALAVTAALAAVSTPSTAEACGGCFVAPENNTVVTDHRMVLSVTPQQTTLYDQIRYQGNPESFAWVLPIAGEAEVGVQWRKHTQGQVGRGAHHPGDPEAGRDVARGPRIVGGSRCPARISESTLSGST